MKHFPSLLALAAVSACASTRAPVVGPLEGASEVPVRYSSRVSGASGPIEATQSPAAAPDDSVLVDVSCTLVEMDREDSRSWLGDGVRGLRASRATAEDALATLERGGEVVQITASRLVVFDGWLGEIAIVDQHAFVEAFEITESEDEQSGERALIGDPVVATVSEGVRFEVRPSVMPDGTTVRLEIGLATADLLDAIAERTARIPGVGAEVTVQQPFCFTQRVDATVELGSESVLVIGGLPTDREDRVLVALVATRTAHPEVAASAP